MRTPPRAEPDRLVAAAREAAGGAMVDGVAPLAARRTHRLFLAQLDGRRVVVKVFSGALRDEPRREWEGLSALAATGLAPQPLHFEDGNEAVVVMSHVEGTPLAPATLDDAAIAAIAAAHAAVHGARGYEGRALNHPAEVLARAQAFLDEGLGRAGEIRQSHDVDIAIRAALDWLERDGHLVTEVEDARFCRGDTNLANYLVDEGGRMTIVDLEDCGRNDPVFEVADLIEHASARAVAAERWAPLVDVLDLDDHGRARLLAGRRLMAAFWLGVLLWRERRALPSDLTSGQQAERVVSLLSA